MKITLRIWILIIVLVLSLIAIRPSFESGVLIKSVDRDSKIAEEGIRQGEIIKGVNGEKISSLEDYAKVMNSIFSTEGEKRIDITTKERTYIILTNETPKIVVGKISQTNIQTGLDIRGGARALVQPDQELTDSELKDLIDISSNRFNVFGISDVKIRGVSDLSGNKFMLVEIAGATPTDLEDLISQQGKFEARIKDQIVFVGGNEDITSVCRNDATCSGVQSCTPFQGGYSCSFAFTIYLSGEAAQRHANITGSLGLDSESGGRYLDENLTLILDEEIVDELRISSGLKGQATTQISIQGSGQGATQEEAFENARSDMHHLQTVLITGSLPYKLTIVKLDTISPVLGDQFVFLILLAGAASIVAVGLIVLIRYRKLKASAALLLTSFSELIIILGFAALIKWNLDLPSIAGILATIGTGVDQQIVILDEARTNKQSNIKQRMKNALFVVMTAYLTALFALIPLYWAGAGLFKGFAITSIIGITAGVLITRPAFADMIRKMEE